MSRRRERTRVKICGITTPEAARCAIDAGADAIGLVFASGSPRQISVETATRILREVDTTLVTVVAVHRNLDFEGSDGPDPRSLELADANQLHGNEDEATVKAVAAAHGPVVRGFAFDADEIRRWDANDRVAALLIDGPGGGSGEPFDHARLAVLMPGITKPVILAGGLTPESVGVAIGVVHPYAVDVSSGVESAPGVKDPERIAAFCAAVRRADAASESTSDV